MESESSPPPVRVGVVIESLVVPRWVARVVSELASSSVAELVVAVVCSSGPGCARERAGRTAWWHTLLYRLYTRIDDLGFRYAGDASDFIDLAPLLQACPLLRLSDGEIGRRLSELHPDVIVELGGQLGELPTDELRHGVWSLRFGEQAAPCGFREVMSEHPVTGVTLEMHRERTCAAVLARLYEATDRRSVRRNRATVEARAPFLVLRALRDLRDGDPEPLQFATRPSAEPPSEVPTNRETARGVARLVRRYAAEAMCRLTHREQWCVLYRLDGAKEPPYAGLGDFTRIVPPGDRSWADPFPVLRDGRYAIFIEVLMHETGKGHIGAILMDPSGRWEQPCPVLERPYHLSYPCVFEHGAELLMVPESAASRTVELYRCVAFPDRWEPVDILLHDVRGVDPTVVCLDGRWWMFLHLPEGDPSENDELHLYVADRPQGPWRAHRRNPVKSDVRGARPAGPHLRARRAIPSTGSGLLAALRSRRDRAPNRAALGDGVLRGGGRAARARPRPRRGAHAEPRRRPDGCRRSDQPPEVAPMSVAAASETRARFARSITRLQLWYVRQLLVRGDIRTGGVPTALTRRVNIYRRTVLWDGVHDPATGHRDRAWEQLAATLAALVQKAAADDGRHLEETGLAILWPLLEPTLARAERVPAAGRFGCWSYRPVGEGIGSRPGMRGALRNLPYLRERLRRSLALPPAPPRNVELHFENVHAPRSPFEAIPALAGSLLALVEDCAASHPSVRYVWANTWLNSHPSFLALFPPSWRRSGIVPRAGNHGNWWGQFVTRDGDFNDVLGERFRASGGEFPYPALACRAELGELVAHLAGRWARRSGHARMNFP